MRGSVAKRAEQMLAIVFLELEVREGVERLVLVCRVRAQLAYEGARFVQANRVQVDPRTQLRQASAEMLVLFQNGACRTRVCALERRKQVSLFGFHVRVQASIELGPYRSHVLP